MDTTETSSTAAQPLPREWVKRIFEVQLLTYGESFPRKWHNVDPEDMIGFWARLLAGYTPAEIKRGLDNLPPRFPPDAHEFCELCRPTLSPEAAYHEAIYQLGKRLVGMDEWPEPAIFWAATEFGQNDLRASSWPFVKDRWKLLLDKARQECRLDVPKAPLALAAPPRQDATEPPPAVVEQLRAFGFKFDPKRGIS